jgi:hypothetical protein
MLQFLLDHTDTTKAWTAYASYIRSLPLDVARKCYNILFERFPTTGIFVVQYCQLEEKAKNIQRVVDVREKGDCESRHWRDFSLAVRPFHSGHTTVNSSGDTIWREK